MTSAAATLSSTPSEWSARLAALKPGVRLTIVGLDITKLAANRPSNISPLLTLEPARVGLSHEAAVADILDDLADIALTVWPAWPPWSLSPWRRAADRLAAVGRRPRFTRVPLPTQFIALHSAAGAPILVFPLDPVRPERAAPLISALEWTCRHGAPVVALLDDFPPSEPPWDRVLYGALVVSPSTPASAASRFVPTPTAGLYGSATERRIRAELARSEDLAGLFENEATLHLGPLGLAPRVDLLWREGKVVVELDGAEHERDPNYGADRHRDFELLVAGYLVLRLTNAEIERDLARSIDKIRRVVDLRRTFA